MGSNALQDAPYSLIPQPERVKQFGSITATYTLVGTKFSEGIVSLYIYSSFDSEIKLSLDGTNDWITLPTGPSAFIFDAKSNKAPIPGSFGVYAKQNLTLPSSGTLYVSAMTVA